MCGEFARAAFICISIDEQVTAARSAALSFGSRLRLQHVINCYSEVQPRTGQLGCSGFIGIKPNGAMIIPATPPYLAYGHTAFRSVAFGSLSLHACFDAVCNRLACL